MTDEAVLLTTDIKVFTLDEVEIDFDEELGHGSHGITYEARLRPSDAIVAVKLLSPVFKFDDVYSALLSYRASLQQLSTLSDDNMFTGSDGDTTARGAPVTTIRGSEIIKRHVVPLGLCRLTVGQKQTGLVLPRADTTVEKEMKRFGVPMLDVMSWISTIGDVVETADTITEVMQRDRDMVLTPVAPRCGIRHREIKPCDLLLFRNCVIPSTDAPESTQHAAWSVKWFPMLNLPVKAVGGVLPARSRFTDPALGMDVAIVAETQWLPSADADADIFSLSVLLWETIERRPVSLAASAEPPMPENTLIPRELRQCIQLGLSGRRDTRCSLQALCSELRYTIRTLTVRLQEDSAYMLRKAHQDQLRSRVLDIFTNAISQIQQMYQEARQIGVGYSVEVEAPTRTGHVRFAVGTSAETIDFQYRSSNVLPAALPSWSGNSGGVLRPYEPPLRVFHETVEQTNPALKQSSAFAEVVDVVETIDLSDGTPKTRCSAVRISNFRQLACTPTLEYTDAAVEGFLCECTHIKEIDLSPLRTHVTRIGDFFLFNCNNITHLHLDPLENVTVIGFAFLAGCRSLKQINFKPLSNVLSVGANFLHNCSSLEELDLTPFAQVADFSVHSKLMTGCTKLNRLRIPRCMSIEMVHVHIGAWVEENDKWWEFTGGERTYFIPRLEP